MCLRVTEQPRAVDDNRIVATAGFRQNITGLAQAAQQPVERSAPDSEHLGRRFVRLGQAGTVRLDRSTSQLQRNGSHSKVRSRLADHVKIETV